ncbi:helix-turn-helix domain-containing protein [bacterium]|uniref:Uncharacterized protein n=2 Tax=Candidatus Nealsoniibacteriota TaxID=1817911 RepID=A0A2M7EB62_9BACT|nr:helix-turn-helix domain-containing protein [bacterium]PIV64914.1 MAG: hypothetical protein COS09_02325 [Candidatus Nealsonbacteria bacterium CG01_land_8_20_14_3_00_12]PJA83763.1 MAG: hypothetical protein CO146_00610 [Candidatus Nealsonbacteria bacterium CG_4_9_14_3_um_filter_37_29]
MDKTKYPQLKRRAIQFRKHGFSYREIGQKLGVAKSTIRFWCINVLLSPADRKRLYTRQVLLLSRGPNSQKERREREIAKIIEEAEKEIKIPLSFETYRLIGAFLYWSEGSKTNGFSFSNSDPHFVLFVTRWLKRVLGISPGNLKAWLNIYPQQNDLEIKRFWSELTGIPFENFGKSFTKPPNKGFKKNNLYYGTIKIKVPKGTDMRYRVFGWIKTVLKDIAPEVELKQKEWKSLKETPRPVNIQEKIEV